MGNQIDKPEFYFGGANRHASDYEAIQYAREKLGIRTVRGHNG